MERWMEPQPQSMGFQSGELTAAALGAAFLIVFVVAVIVGLSRLLQHRETLKMLELGGDAETALRQRERWRKRAGLLHGVKLLVIGIVFIAMTQVSSTWLAMMTPKRDVPTEWLTTPPAFLLVGLILSAVGAVYIVAFSIWSRSEDGSPEGAPTGPRSFTALDRRTAVMRGVILALVGGAVLLLTPAFAVLSRDIRGQFLEMEHISGVIGVLLIVLGIVVGVAYGTMPTTPAAEERQPKAAREEQPAEDEGE